MENKQWPLTCYVLDKLNMWDISGCCDSCHEDVNYGFPLIDGTLPDGREILVCCRCKPWDATTQEDLEVS